MTRTISIVGAGRVGKTLGKCLHRLGWRIEAVVSRSKVHARAAVRSIGAGTPCAGITPEVFDADIILLTAPDTALPQVARDLARAGGRKCHRKIALHTSGALEGTILAPLARCGASTGSLHPMQTFTGREVPKLKGVIFAVEGDPRARRMAAQIARELGGTPVRIDGKNKAAYHAAAALVAGHGLALVEAASQVLLKLGFTHRRAAQALLPLTRQMLDNFEAVGPQRAWTGPISRGDYAIVAAHMKSLRNYPREFASAYAALAFLGGRVLAKDSAVTIPRLRRALK